MENIDIVSWTIVFTDLKDFTLKTSLLTQKQIDNLLDTQDKIIVDNIKKYDWILIKTIWDSYMVFFENPKNALFFSIDIQKETYEYNKNKSLKLQKIEIRISINYWTVNKKQTINWVDYFWDCVNLASRVLSKTLENKIFITDKFYNKIKDENLKEEFLLLWNTSFKWILYEVEIYNVLFLEEDIEDYKKWVYKKVDYTDVIIDEKIKTRCKNIDDIIFRWSAINAVFWVQPIPFFDIYSSIAVYIYMLRQIAIEYNIILSQKEIKEILVTIFWAISWVLAINQTISWVSKIWLVWFWGFLMVPLNYWTAYWVGKVMNRYFYNKTKDLKFTNEEIKELFLSWKNYWVKYAKNNKKEIIKNGKNFKNEFNLNLKKEKSELKDITTSIKKEIKN